MDITNQSQGSFVVRPVVAAVALAVASFAHAQEAKKDESVQLEKVVVTANKRAQNLQDVPVAITVLNDEVLQRNNVKDFDNLPALSPALSVTYSTQPGNYSINMRGIGTFSLGVGVEADVSVIIDDIPFAMQANAFKDLADVNRIEVLKGPQSTLMGKSSIAGAVNISTKPIDSLWKSKVSTYLTNDHEWRISGSTSGALSDTVRMRLAAGKSANPGVVKNLTDGKNLNGSDDTNFAGKLEWNPDDQWSVMFAPRYSKFNKNCCVSPFRMMTNTGGLYNINNGFTYASNNDRIPVSKILGGIVPGPDNVSVRNDYPAGGNAKDMGAGLKVGYAFGDSGFLANHTLTSITSWSHYMMDDYQDGDFTDSDVLNKTLIGGKPTNLHGGLFQQGHFDVKSKTEELRLTSPDKGRLRYVAGLFYGKNELGRHLGRFPAGTYITDYTASAENTNYAIFGNGTFDLTSQTSIIAGLRFNREDVAYTFDSPLVAPTVASRTQHHYEGTDAENKKTGKLGLEHRFNPDAMGYVTYSTGHKGKGIDLTSTFNDNNYKNGFVPGEDAHSVEAGLKLTLLDNRMSLDLAAFKTDFKGFQQSAGQTDADGIYRTQLHSIGNVRTSGLEADMNWRVTRDLLLNGSFAYTKAIVTEFPNGPCYSVINAAGTGTTPGGNCIVKNPLFGNSNTADLAGMPMPNAPKYKLNMGGQYEIRTDMPFDGFVNAAYRWQSKVNYRIDQDPTSIQKSYGIFNLGGGIKDKKGGWKLSFMINNLFNKSYAASLGNVGYFNTMYGSTAAAPVHIQQWTPARDYQRYYSMRADFAF
ncbi:TonB-dependent receptor [Pseudoduganella eburnea]|uniref:TonB-dependent receptor n=1 Tax=Massilia eburnea TaxID=1776165 RepID=A0A6L6QGR6_9BURK|nr:TonB-dependent receptor [Massilia eburnea]